MAKYNRTCDRFLCEEREDLEVSPQEDMFGDFCLVLMCHTHAFLQKAAWGEIAAPSLDPR